VIHVKMRRRAAEVRRMTSGEIGGGADGMLHFLNNVCWADAITG